LRILKPIYKFIANDPESLYEMIKEYDWSQILTLDKTFAIDVTAYSDEFTHSRYVTYRVKDAIVDYFTDRFGQGARPKVRLTGADVLINVHIAGDRVTISLDSSGESLHKRGYRVEQTEAPINEVLAAGIILKSGWKGECPLVDPMCGSGTFLVEAALIAANINPGIYRKSFAFEQWKDFDAELFDRLYNDDSDEREADFKIFGADISPRAVAIAEANIKSAGVGRYINLQVKPISQWNEAPGAGIDGETGGVLITNPPYGERISVDDMDGLYETIGQKLKRVFTGYHAWIIGYHEEYFQKIGLAPSQKIQLLNGALECELREYIIFDGDYQSFRAAGGRLKEVEEQQDRRKMRKERMGDREWKREAREKGFGGRDSRDSKPRFRDRDDKPRFRDRDDKPRFRDRDDSKPRFRDRDEKPSFRDRDDKPRFRDRDDKPRFRDRDDNGQRRPNKLEERYRPTSPRFRDRDDSKPRFNDRDRRDDSQPESENPLARRRNVEALKSITGRRPSLQGPLMRGRRGWKRPDDNIDEK
jgi:putative N6-adenine-specific DNA methylase